MADFYERLKKAMELRNVSQTELCEMTSIPKSAMSQYISGSFKPKQKRTYLLAKALNVNEAWLMGYDVEIERSNDTLFDRFSNLSPIHLKKFPMLGKIACGEPIWADEDKEHYVMAGMDIKADFCLTAKGDSMVNARINDGDIVFIRQQPIVENGEIAAVIIGDEATLKRWYFYKEESKLMLVAENPKYPPLVYMNEELETVRCLGKAVYFMSAL